MLSYSHSLADVAVAEVHIDDGSIRTAWETEDGLQYVEDDNGERVYGVWYIPPHEDSVPVIVRARAAGDLVTCAPVALSSDETDDNSLATHLRYE